jgi:hypothetical protein
MSQDNIFPILAAIGFNDGANKGFWRVQPREQFGEDAGQWIEMGAELRMFYKDQRGQTANVTGRAVGSTGTPDGVRVLVQGQEGVPDGIYGASTSSVRVAEGFIPDEVLKKQGIENTVKISKEQEAALPTLDSLERADITDEDLRLINEGANSKEGKQHAEYRKAAEAEADAGGPQSAPSEPADTLDSKKDDLRGPDELYVDDEGIEYAWPDSFRVPESTRDLTEVSPADQTDEEIAFQIGGKGGSNLSDEQYDALSAEAKNRIDARTSDDPERYNEPIEPTNIAPEEVAVLDAYGKAFFNDPVPNDEMVVNFAKSPPKDTELKFPEELEPGDIVRGKDNSGIPYEGVVQEKPFDKGALRDNTRIYGIRLRIGDQVYTLTQRKDDGVQVVKGRKGLVVAPGPNNNNTPIPPTKPPKPPKPVTPGKSSKVMDNGKLIPRQSFTSKQLEFLRGAKLEQLIDEDGAAAIEFDSKGKPFNPRDPNAMMNLLAETYTGSKFNKQNQLVLMREVADEGGRKIQWEIRAFLSGEKKVGYMFVFKDLKTQEETTLIHKDMRDSTKALFGKTNGPETLADILTGVQTRRYNAQNDTVNANNVLERANYFKLQGRTKTIADTAKYYATGYAERINYSSGTGTLLEKKVPSVYEAFDSGDADATFERLKAVFGRIPYDDASHEEARTAIREQYAALYPTADKRSFGILVTRASQTMRNELLSKLSRRAVPYSSADRITAIEPGNIVEYVNNIGEISTVRVLNRQKVNTANVDGGFDYGDYVTIIGSDGIPTSAPTNALKLLKNQETPLTELKGRVSGPALAQARGMVYRSTSIIFPGQTEVTDVDAPIDNLVPGDNLYSKAGERLGAAVEVVPITSSTGKKGYGILYVTPDGEVKKVAIASGEVRGPNLVLSGAEAAPEAPEAPESKKSIISDIEESDPDFDLDSIEFETDPDTVKVPITLKSNFTLPINAKRTIEEQLALNEEIRNELRLRNTELSNVLEGWTYNDDSMNVGSYISNPELRQQVMDAWKLSYPNLSDDEIRQIMELNNSKASGYFNMSKQQMLNELLKRGAEYTKPDGAIRQIQFSVRFNTESGKNELSVTDQEKTAYLSSIDDIEKFASTAELGKFFDPKKQVIKIIDTETDFKATYIGVTGKPRDTSNVLGVNISRGGTQSDPTKPIVILINNARIRRVANDPNDKSTFKNVYGDTLTHEFGHSIHETLQSQSFGKNNSSYSEAYKEFISEYGETSHMEHFAESFAKYVQLGEAPPGFLAFLKSVGLVEN